MGYTICMCMIPTSGPIQSSNIFPKAKYICMQLGTGRLCSGSNPFLTYHYSAIVMVTNWYNNGWCHKPLTALTHCGLVKPYGNRDLGQHWLRQWLVAWQHQAITWTNVDWSSVKFSDIHIRAISQEVPQPSVTKIHLKITYLWFH